MDPIEDKGGATLLNQNLNDSKSALPKEEIVSSSPSHKSWKGIVIAILVILLISGLIILAIYFTSPGGIKADYGQKFTFRDIFVARNLQKSLIYQWIGKDLLSYVNETDEILLLNLNSLTEKQLIGKTYLEEKKAFSSSVSLSRDGNYLFISYNHSANYRRSSSAQYAVFSVSNKEINTEIGFPQPVPLQSAEWSPNGHSLAFVYNNNVYYNEDPLDNSKIISITKDLRQSSQISYGVADWLYEEEILKKTTALWWSTSGSNIAFLSFNDEEVQNYRIKVYGDHDDLNGHFIDVSYPKAGQVPKAKNPVVNPYVYNIQRKQLYNIPIPKHIPVDYYITFVKWIDDDHLLIGWMNREQNEAWLSIAQNWTESKVPDSWVIYHDQTSNGWINMLKQTNVEPIMFPSQKRIFLIENRITRLTEYRNIAELSLSYIPNKFALKKWTITADFDFTDILFFDGTSTMYFSAVLPNDSKELHLYKANINTGKYECQSCNSQNCTYNQFDFNPHGKYFIYSCLGPSIPTFNLMKIDKQVDDSRINTQRSKICAERCIQYLETLCCRTDTTLNKRFILRKLEKLRMLINNTDLKSMLSTKAMPKVEYQKVSIKINSTHSIELESKISLPITLNKKHVTRYPLLLNVYAGPSSQAVTTKFSVDWTTYLVSSLNIINLQIDGRGTLNRGRQFERAVYKNMGKIEIHDQIKATEKLVSELHFINKSQIGVYGWSYGGFVVSHILASVDNKLIRCGISVAPVTSFDYYDTAYTERYLGLKEKNPLAYKQTDISNFAKFFKDDMKKNFLLIHGTKDDNVHFLNSAKLIRSLIAVEYDFDVMVYPDEAHSLSGFRTHFHVFRKITTFLMNCYNKTSVENYINLYE